MLTAPDGNSKGKCIDDGGCGGGRGVYVCSVVWYGMKRKTRKEHFESAELAFHGS